MSCDYLEWDESKFCALDPRPSMLGGAPVSWEGLVDNYQMERCIRARTHSPLCSQHSLSAGAESDAPASHIALFMHISEIT